MNRSEHIAEAERLIVLSRERNTSTQMQLDLTEARIHAELAKSADDEPTSKELIPGEDGVRDASAVTGWAPGQSPRSIYGDDH